MQFDNQNQFLFFINANTSLLQLHSVCIMMVFTSPEGYIMFFFFHLVVIGGMSRGVYATRTVGIIKVNRFQPLHILQDVFSFLFLSCIIGYTMEKKLTRIRGQMVHTILKCRQQRFITKQSFNYLGSISRLFYDPWCLQLKQLCSVLPQNIRGLCPYSNTKTLLCFCLGVQITQQMSKCQKWLAVTLAPLIVVKLLLQA